MSACSLLKIPRLLNTSQMSERWLCDFPAGNRSALTWAIGLAQATSSASHHPLYQKLSSGPPPNPWKAGKGRGLMAWTERAQRLLTPVPSENRQENWRLKTCPGLFGTLRSSPIHSLVPPKSWLSGCWYYTLANTILWLTSEGPWNNSKRDIKIIRFIW